MAAEAQVNRAIPMAGSTQREEPAAAAGGQCHCLFICTAFALSCQHFIRCTKYNKDQVTMLGGCQLKKRTLHPPPLGVCNVLRRSIRRGLAGSVHALARRTGHA